MKKIAQNEYYELNYSEEDNCIYWKMTGFWPDMSVVPDFQKDWDSARALTRPGWKIFSDARKCRVVPNEVNQEKILNQEKSIEAGCSKIALITDSAITKMSIKNGLEKSGIDGIIKNFNHTQMDEAWEWLAV